MHLQVTRRFNTRTHKFGQWYYKLVSSNGQTLFNSETFNTKWYAKWRANKIAEANGWSVRVLGEDN